MSCSACRAVETRRQRAQVESGAQWHGHGKAPLKSSARPEQLVEEVAEPRFKHVHLGLRDRHALGPIVRDGPGREIVLRRPANARPWLQRGVKVVGQNAQAEAWTGHSVSIAPLGLGANDRSLSHDTLFPPGKSVMKGADAPTLNHNRLASPRWAGDSRSRPKPRSGGAERASLDGLTAVRPARAKAVMAQLALRDSVSGRSSSTRSCITLGVIRPRSPRSRRTRP